MSLSLTSQYCDTAGRSCICWSRALEHSVYTHCTSRTGTLGLVDPLQCTWEISLPSWGGEKIIRQIMRSHRSTKMLKKMIRAKKPIFRDENDSEILQQLCICLTALKHYLERECTLVETGGSPERGCPLENAWWRSPEPGPRTAAAAEAAGSPMTPAWWRPESRCWRSCWPQSKGRAESRSPPRGWCLHTSASEVLSDKNNKTSDFRQNRGLSRHSHFGWLPQAYMRSNVSAYMADCIFKRMPKGKLMERKQ